MSFKDDSKPLFFFSVFCLHNNDNCNRWVYNNNNSTHLHHHHSQTHTHTMVIHFSHTYILFDCNQRNSEMKPTRQIIQFFSAFYCFMRFIQIIGFYLLHCGKREKPTTELYITSFSLVLFFLLFEELLV